jgi:hypothetical protein
MDVNGDGLQDIVIGPDAAGKWYVMRNTGTSFVDAGAWITGAYAGWATASPRVRSMDVNGDGLQDIVIGPDGNGAWFVMRSTGTSFVDAGAWITGAYAGWASATDRIRTMDVNGDGLQDIVIGPDAAGKWYVLRPGSPGDKISTLTNGLGAATSITYKPLTDGSVYTKGNGFAPVYPIQDIQSPMYVVSSSSNSNGIGGQYSTSYTYGNAKVDLSGRGFLGFGSVSATDLQTYLKTLTYYNSNYPYTGMPTQQLKQLDISPYTILSNTMNTYTAPVTTVLGTPPALFVGLASSDQTSNDLNGAFIGRSKTTNTYDGLGNASSISVDTLTSAGALMGYNKTTTNLYAPPDLVNWIVGRLVKATVQSTTP